jgi:hypothetical protein
MHAPSVATRQMTYSCQADDRLELDLVQRFLSSPWAL